MDSFAIRKSHAILSLKSACERSQCDFVLFAMLDFLRTFASEPLSRIEDSQLENNFTKQGTKAALGGETRSLCPRKLVFPPVRGLKLMRPSEYQLQNAIAHEL